MSEHFPEHFLLVLILALHLHGLYGVFGFLYVAFAHEKSKPVIEEEAKGQKIWHFFSIATI